jgi:hypothetical protein
VPSVLTAVGFVPAGGYLMSEQNEETMIAGESAHCDFPERTTTQIANLHTIYETRERSLPHVPQSGENLCEPCRGVYESGWMGLTPARAAKITRSSCKFPDPGDGPEERLERAGEDEYLPHARYPEDYVD